MGKPGLRRILLLAALAVCARAQAGDRVNDARLARAITANDTAAAERALAHKADPNRRLAYGAAPLSFAVNTQNSAMVGLLLKKGATPNTVDQDGVTPLALACELGDATIVTMLLSANADVKARAPDGVSPLAICARYGSADIVARMLRSGALPDSLDIRGQSPLMWAAASGRVDAMGILIRAGADVNRVSKGGFTPLAFAIKSGAPKAAEILLAAGAKSDWRGPENTSAAQLAVYQNNFAAAALFVDRGAELAERDRTGRQLLHAAAAAGDTTLVGKLLAKGAYPNGLTGPSRITWVTEANFGVAPAPVPPTPPLLIAAAGGHDAVMRQLVAAGAKPDFVAADGTNVVLAAARGGRAPALELALSLAPNANVANAAGQTPLHLLIGGPGQPDLAAMMRILAAHGARSDIKDKTGATAATIAAAGLNEVRAIFLQNFPAPPDAAKADAAP